MITEQQLIAELNQRLGADKSQAELAREIGIPPSVLSETLNRGRKPGGRLLEWLGYERVRDMYRAREAG